ncbi:MAG TPA: NADP-dependent oxidoreductase [Caldithrix abyssi]|uniref:NADP-dependent oxidoreductase n=1 Tax=Caldithrix abyssi TaxID=187145 RepID=A0A7V4WWC1_CALAY|nr:NADP-dependent oxidoreductase [Caldithrix abyssi]
MQETTQAILLKSRPRGLPTKDNFEFVKLEMPRPQDGEALIRPRYFSVDPYMRNRMNDVKSYIEPYTLNEPLSGDAIGEVIESKTEALKPGDTVAGIFPWQDYVVLAGNKLRKIETGDMPLTAHLGVLGLTGLTAYFGLLDIGQPKKGETVVVSGAAGAVGQVAGQIAKIKGCRVVGIAGSVPKVSYLKEELGFDEAINYKEQRNIRRPLRRACPDGVDVYFDNVGGEISDNVMYMLNDYARIVLCGQIALYNASRIEMGPRLNAQLIIHRVRMEGFIVYDYAPRYPEAVAQLSRWIKEGQVKYSEHIVHGFDRMIEAFLELFSGENLGKQLVAVE